MTAGIAGWGAAMERAFKEVLYRFLEEIHCTKAALYLLSGDGRYVLATQYGFGRRDLLAAEYPADHDLVRHARELRSRARAFNNPDQLPEVTRYLEGAGTARMLLVPLHGGSRVLGFVDARDKGRKLEFDDDDVKRAGDVARAFVQLLQQYALYTGLDEPVEEPRVVEVVSVPRADAEGAELDAGGLRLVVEAAAAAATRSEVTASAVAVVEPRAAVMTLCARGPFPPGDRDALVRHQRETLRQAGLTSPEPAAWEVQVRPVAGPEPAADGRVVASALLLAGRDWGLVGSTVAALGSSAVTDALASLAATAGAAAERVALASQRRLLARKLLQPGERGYPELEAHSLAVSRLVWAMGGLLGLDAGELEGLALAGLLHDVGMRELDYANLYRHRSPGPEERRLYQRHVLLGETILADAGLASLAKVVRAHHERWDGTGYPDRLSGEAIPVAARLVHLAEVYDTLTAAHSYRATLPRPRALAMVRAAAGHQFDPSLVDALEGVVE